MAKVLCLGEILIDQIAGVSGVQVAYSGGAPANVACGLAKLGTSSAFIGCIGKDQVGIELLEALKTNGVDISGVQIHANAPTRQVYVSLDPEGDRHFDRFSGDATTIFADSLLQIVCVKIELIQTVIPEKQGS